MSNFEVADVDFSVDVTVEDVIGLQNLGNTCFLNALLQALSSVEVFQQYLNQYNHQSEFSHTLKEVLNELQSGCALTKKRGYVSPTQLKRILCLKADRFSGRLQQDTEELFQYMMNMIDSHVYHFQRKEFNFFKDLLFPGPCIFKNPFMGICRTVLTCTDCNEVKPANFTPYVNVSLSFPSGGNSWDLVRCINKLNGGNEFYFQKNNHLVDTFNLEDCLDFYTNEEIVEGVDCVNCGLRDEGLGCGNTCLSTDNWTSDDMISNNVDELSQKRHFFKKLQFSQISSCICFHINRKVYNPVRQQMMKLDHHLAFPFSINLERYTCRSGDEDKRQVDEKNSNPFDYALNSVIVHQGDSTSGHYITLKKIDNKWFHLSDLDKSEVSADDVRKSQAYMLFYSKLKLT